MNEFHKPEVRDFVQIRVVKGFAALRPIDMGAVGPKYPGMVTAQGNNFGHWTPQHMFVTDHAESGFLGFEHALWLAKQGFECTRTSWSTGFLTWTIEGLMLDRDSPRSPGAKPWRPSAMDLLATDWRLTEAGSRKARRY